MFKLYFLILTSLYLFPSKSDAQFAEDIRLSILGEYSLYGIDHTKDYAVAGGLELQVYVVNNFSLDYQLLFGTYRGESLYVSTGWGQYAMAFLLTRLGPSEAVGYLAAFALIIPEGASYRIDLKNNLALEPFVHPFEATLTNGLRPYWTGNFGLRCSYTFSKHFAIKPHLSLRWWYFQQEFGFNVGCAFNVLGSQLDYRSVANRMF